MLTERNLTYLFTYLSYFLNHALRMCLSYNKSNIKTVFNVNSFELGIFDALIYLSYGVGAIFRFSIFKGRDLVKMYLISALMISCFYSIIPFVSIFFAGHLLRQNHNFNAQIDHNNSSSFSFSYIDFIILLAYIGYGFFHLAVFQIMVTLMSQKKWHAAKDGLAVGIWATNSSTGNIFGFFLSNFLVEKITLPWQTSMIIFAILNLSVGLGMYWSLEVHPQRKQHCQIKEYNQVQQKNAQGNYQPLALTKQNSRLQNKKAQDIHSLQEQKQITTSQFLHHSKTKFLEFADFRLFIFSYISMKATVYSYLMWYPIFLSSQGYKNSGYISMLFDISSVIGAIGIGKLGEYQKEAIQNSSGLQKDKSSSNKSLPKIFFYKIVQLRWFIMLAISCFLALLYFIVPSSLVSYSILTFCLGGTIGGIFHVYAASNMMLYGDSSKRNVDIISNFSIVMGSLVVGVFQLIIGVVTRGGGGHEGQNQDILKRNQQVLPEKDSYKKFFYVLLFLMILCSTLLFLKAVVWKPTYHMADQRTIENETQIQRELVGKQKTDKLRQL